MDWICAITTLISVELIARHKWQGWAVGVANQLLWLLLILQRELWGLLPLTIVLTWRNLAALRVWMRAEMREVA